MARVCARQARPLGGLGWLVRAGLSGQQQEVDKWLADSGQGASFPQQEILLATQPCGEWGSG